jgi:hypothetical protein
MKEAQTKRSLRRDNYKGRVERRESSKENLRGL